ncbi:MAG: sulfatase-like hydrolase/transferase [Spirochaetales bacterium]|nr:sulfatase-like hydrolase/transferase [Spirochaetales bacterium]
MRKLKLKLIGFLSVLFTRTLEMSTKYLCLKRLSLLIAGFAVFLNIEAVYAAPNIILILNDDMGYSDLNCYGGEIQTPNLDNLANTGVKFTQFYNTARCCPTRASLLTGLHPHQAGMGWMWNKDYGVPGYQGDINNNCVTIAEALKTNGYRTYATGKWHLTSSGNSTASGPKYNWPLQRGFDRYYGIIKGAANYFEPDSLTIDNDMITVSELLNRYPVSPGPSTYYLTDAISDASAQYIRDHKNNNSGSPFFMYVAYTAPHWPLQALDSDINKYADVFNTGWDQLRTNRYNRQKQLGIIDSSWPLTPRADNVAAWSSYTGNKTEQATYMQIYAAMIDRMDQGIGKIIQALQDTGYYNDTLVMFLADNGGCAEGGAYGTNSGGAPLGSKDSFLEYGAAWANVSNTPFYLFKHFVHEGGIAAPFIAHWPNGITVPNGSIIKTPAELIDIMATCVDVSGTAYPRSYNGYTIQPMQGVSIRPLLQGNSLSRDTLYWEHEARSAIRQGKWKAVRPCAAGQNPFNQAWELYDMDADRTEMNNLAGAYPGTVNDLADKWDAWAKANNVYPLHNQNGAAFYPPSGGYVRLENLELAEWLQCTDTPDGSGENNNVRAVNTSKTGTYTQWRFLDTGDGYYRIEDLGHMYWLQASNLTDATNGQPDSSVIPQVVRAADTTNTGDYTKWRKINTGNGYFRLENKATGLWLQCTNITDVDTGSGDGGLQVRLVPNTKTGTWTQWREVLVGSPTSVPTNTPAPTATRTPVPAATPTRTPTPSPTASQTPASSATPTPSPTSASGTDRTDAGGTITAQYDDSPGGEDMNKAFDNTSSTKYLTFHASGWIQFQFTGGNTYAINSYALTSANDAEERDPLTWTLQGSNNGSSYSTIDSRNGEDFPDRFQRKVFTFANSMAYNIIRLNMTNNSGTILQIAEIELFGGPGAANPTATPTPTRTTAATATATPTPTPSPVPAGFNDSFNDNSIGSAWTMYGGSWSESGGILRQDSTTQGDPCKAIITGSGLNAAGNQTIIAKVYVDSWTDGDTARAGVSLLSGTGDGRGYNLLFHNNHSTVQFLDDAVSWGTGYTFNWSDQTWYWFKLKMENGALYGKVWQDGTGEPSNWPYSWTRSGRSGYPALNGGTSGHGGSCTVFFDDVSITVP